MAAIFIRWALPAYFLLISTGEIHGQPPLVLVATEDPPYMYQEKGAAKGITVTILNRVFHELGHPIKIKFYPWNRAIRLVKARKADGIFTILETEERRRFLVFPEEALITMEWVIFHRKDRTLNYEKLADLKGLRLGITAGYDYGKAIHEPNLFQLDEVISDEKNFEKLFRNRIDIFITDKHMGIHKLNEMGIADEITHIKKPYAIWHTHLAFSRKPNHRKLCKDFSDTLKKLKATGAISLPNRMSPLR
ncbi:MAG: transporter substrate-binding domain-containing protein [Desulfobacteraceae bacterium]|nr:transporter substrate-binding domain-containing protein [Desulfobacteraceae bacterium]